MKFYVWSLLLILLFGCGNQEPDLYKCFGNKYSQLEQELFLECGFLDQDRVMRWENDISISYEGNLSNEDIANLDSLIEEFSPLLKPIKIQRVEKNANVIFYFTEDFMGEMQSVSGLTERGHNLFSNEIIRSNIWVAPHINAMARRKIMQHEFMHTLGLDHSKASGLILSKNEGAKVFSSIEEAELYLNTYKRIDGLDKTLVTMLYDECIPPGLTKAEFERYLARLKSKK